MYASYGTWVVAYYPSAPILTFLMKASFFHARADQFIELIENRYQPFMKECEKYVAVERNRTGNSKSKKELTNAVDAVNSQSLVLQSVKKDNWCPKFYISLSREMIGVPNSIFYCQENAIEIPKYSNLSQKQS